MSSSGVNEGGEEIKKKSVVNPYLNSVMAPPKILRFNEGVLLVEDVEAPGSWRRTLIGTASSSSVALMLTSS
jgi:hypothetical protein